MHVTAERYDACMAHVDHNYTLGDFNATLRLHYVRPDADGRPKFKELARVLACHLGYYAISAKRHQDAKDQVDEARILQDAKALLRGYSKSGEAGELLLYFLVEAVLRAPQVICKMALKTNRKDEVKGSDGVHVKWDSARGRLILYFGEAKLYADLTAALNAAFKSMEAFHAEVAAEHETFLVCTHFNLLDEVLHQRVCAYLDKTNSAETYETHHVCLVGFDWDEYGDLDDHTKRRAFLAEFEQRYLKCGSAIRAKVEKQLKEFKQNHLTFEFFFIPFKSVEDFRKWFFETVFGGTIK